MATAASGDHESEPAWLARLLLRSVRSASLATSERGQPFASLVTPACAPDLSILLLLSGLSAHTRHLRADGRCSILACGAAVDANPQTIPRVTVTGVAVRDDDPALRARFLAVHPYAALYAGFADFAVWRIPPAAALFVGGFGRAARFSGEALRPEAAAVGAIAAAEAGICAAWNADRADAVAAIGARSAGRAGAWRMVTADVDGCDLALEETVARVAWSGPASGPEDVRRELVRLAGLAAPVDP